MGRGQKAGGKFKKAENWKKQKKKKKKTGGKKKKKEKRKEGKKIKKKQLRCGRKRGKGGKERREKAKEGGEGKEGKGKKRNNRQRTRDTEMRNGELTKSIMWEKRQKSTKKETGDGECLTRKENAQKGRINTKKSRCTVEKTKTQGRALWQLRDCQSLIKSTSRHGTTRLREWKKVLDGNRKNLHAKKGQGKKKGGKATGGKTGGAPNQSPD